MTKNIYTCNICKKDKQVTNFYKNKTKKFGINTICKLCQQKYNKKYYLNNKNNILIRSKRWQKDNRKQNYIDNRNKILKRQADRAQRNRKYIWDIKLQNPCNCGESNPSQERNKIMKKMIEKYCFPVHEIWKDKQLTNFSKVLLTPIAALSYWVIFGGVQITVIILEKLPTCLWACVKRFFIK